MCNTGPVRVTNRPGRVRAGVSPLLFFGVSAVITFAIMAAWSIAMPRFSGPDEPSQVVHAVAVARGQLVGNTPGGPQTQGPSCESREYLRTG